MKKFNTYFSRLFSLIIVATWAISAQAVTTYDLSTTEIVDISTDVTWPWFRADNTAGVSNGTFLPGVTDGTDTYNMLYAVTGSGNEVFPDNGYSHTFNGVTKTGIITLRKSSAIGFKIGTDATYGVKIYFKSQSSRCARLLKGAKFNNDGTLDNGTVIVKELYGTGQNNDKPISVIEMRNLEAGYYWITGWEDGGNGDVRFFGIEFLAEGNPSQSLTQISDNYLWIASSGLTLPGDAMHSANDNKIYHLGSTAISQGTTKIRPQAGGEFNGLTVNGTLTYGYDMPANEAVGFKLAAGKYRVNIFTNDYRDNLLHAGATAPMIGGNGISGQKTVIYDINGEDTGTRMLTYTLNLSDATTYWVSSASPIVLGAIEILKYTDAAPTSNTGTLTNWYVTGNSGNMNDAAGVSRWYPHGLNDGTFAVSGPIMLQDGLTISGRKTVMLNKENGFGIKMAHGTVKALTVKAKGANNTPIYIKKGNTLATATTTVASTTTKGYADADVVTFSTVIEADANNDEIYWITAGDDFVYVDDITFAEPTATAPDLVAIDDNFLMYYNGGAGTYYGSNGYYSTDRRTYRKSTETSGVTIEGIRTTDTPTVAGANGIYVNGSWVGGNDGSQYYYGYYNVEAGDAIGFKLAAGKKYRIRLFVDNATANPLYVGNMIDRATQVNGYSFGIMDWVGGELTAVGTNLWTYDNIDGNDQTFWIKSSTGLKFGGLEILPYSTSQSTTLSKPVLADDWYVQDNTGTHENNYEAGRNFDFLTKGTHNNVLVYGPDMAINTYSNERHKSVLLNNGNAIGLKVPANATLHFRYTAASGGLVSVTDQAIGGTAYTVSEVNSSLFRDVTLAPANSERTVWIKGTGTDYVYLYGMTFDREGLTCLTPIDNNYLWFATESVQLPANDYVDTEKKTYHEGSALSAGTTEVTIAYNKFKGYDLTSGHLVGFAIEEGMSGIIELYYKGTMTLNGTGITKLTSTTTFDDGTKLDTYKFDTTSGKQTYTITGTGTLGGFDVMKNYSRGIPTVKTDTYWNTGRSYDANGFKNALTGAAYRAFHTISANICAFFGPARLFINNDTFDKRSILFNNLNAFAFSTEAGNNVTVRVRYLGKGDTDAGLRLVTGSYTSPTSTLATWNCDGTDNVKVEEYTYRSAGETLYITGINDKNVFLSSFDIEITNPNVTPETIEQHHLYMAEEDMKNGKLYDDAYMLYKGTSPMSVNNSTKIDVMDQSVPTYQFTSNDYLGFKVDEGKTGVIRVYYTPKTSFDLTTSDQSAMTSGWNSSYDATTKTITFNYSSTGETNASADDYDAGRGWWFGDTESTVKNLSAYNELVIELAEGLPMSVQLVADDYNGVAIASPIYQKGETTLRLNLNQAGFDKSKVTQLWVQIVKFIKDKGSNKMVLRSAEVVNNAPVLAKGSDANTPANSPNLANNATISLDKGTYVLEYRFDANSADQMYWVSGDMNLGAVEVIYDVTYNKEKIVEWFVNKNTKMIVGSDDPNFTCKDWAGNDLNYQKDTKGNSITGVDEYVTFYVSAGQRAKVSWMMPQVSRDIIAWDKAVAKAIEDEVIKDGTKDPYGIQIDEAAKVGDDLKYQSIIDSYGKHTVEVKIVNATDAAGGGTRTFNRTKLKGDKTNINSLKDNQFDCMRGWYSSEVLLPNYEKIDGHSGNRVEEIKIIATQKLSGDSLKIKEQQSLTIPDQKKWTVFMRFIFIDAPVCHVPDENTQKVSTSADVTIDGGQANYDYYYTSDSTLPVDLTDATISRDEEFSTTKYTVGSTLNFNYNCFVQAAQFIPTPYAFYVDGKGSDISRKFRLLSNDQPIELKDRPDVIYVHKPTVTNDVRHGGRMNELKDESNNTLMKIMYGSDARPYFRSLSGIYDFRIGAVKWNAGTSAQDDGYKTFVDSYQYAMFGGEYDPKEEADVPYIKYPYTDTHGANTNQKPNGNPNTECNDGIGGKSTEDGGLFLAPIAGDYIRLEPEYDGVISLWIRQNGAVEYETMENGEITRRPTYVVDENGKIMRASTVKPTAKHHMGINGMYAVNAGNSEFRYTFEHTWLYGTSRQIVKGISAADEHWMKVNDSDTINDYRSSYLLYGMWYDGLDIDATRSSISSAKYASRFNWMGNQPLYRGDWLYNQENEVLGLKTKFAKYGYEVPNFTYVRYRIPVKAGKSYYVGERGSKNGFIAVQFEPIECNINKKNDTNLSIEKYRYADNPDVVEDVETRQHFDWTKADGSRKSNNTSYDRSTALATYSTGSTKRIVDLTIDETLTTNQATIDNLKIDDYNLDNLSYKNVYGVTANVTLNRKFTAGFWHPIVLPFSVSESKMREIFGDGVQVLYLDPIEHSYGNEACDDGTWRSVINPAIENSTLTFTYHRYQMLYANVPAFICPDFTWTVGDNVTHPSTTENGRYVRSNIVFERVTLEKTNLNTDSKGNLKIGYDIGGGYEIVGSYDKVKPEVDMYFISNSGGTGTNVATMYRDPEGSTEMKGTRVWIQRKTNHAAPLRTISYSDFTGDRYENTVDGTPDIQDIIKDNTTIEMYNDDNVYDVTGRVVGYGSLDNMPKGVYIFHGKKEYVR